MHDATLVLMTLNELPSLRAMWQRLELLRPEVLLAVDGGSSDGTVEFLREKGVDVLLQTTPGWGEAARLAMSQARTRRIVFFSVDGEQDPDDIPLLLSQLEAGFDLVIASRFLPGSVHAQDGEYLRARARGCRALTRLANRLFGSGKALTDATHGFRAISREAWQRLHLDASGFELAYQMTIQALKVGLNVGEIPTFEAPRIAGQGKKRLFSAGVDHLGVLVAELRRS